MIPVQNHSGIHRYHYGMLPTVRQLQVFQAVAAELHFGRAAARLRLSQPTVSKEVARLERAVGAELLQRSSGGTSLTTEGADLLPHAERVLAALAEFDRAAGTTSRRRTREVRAAASPSIVNRLMPALLRRLERTHPEIEVSVVEVDTGGVSAALDEGRADLGLGHHLPRPAHGRVRTIGRDELFVIASDSVLGRGGALDLDRLVHVPLLLWPREQSPVYYDALLGILRARGLDPLLLSGTSRLTGSRAYLLREGRAFALGPRDFAVSEAHGVRARPLTPPAHVPLDLAWVDPPAPAARIAMDLVRAVVTEGRD